MKSDLNTIRNKVPGLSYAFIENVDAPIIASLKISTNIKPIFLGLEGLKNICGKYWTIESIIEGNPRYLVFCLKKACN